MADYHTMSAFIVEGTIEEQEWLRKVIDLLEHGADSDWENVEGVAAFKEMLGWEDDFPECWGWDLDVMGSGGLHFSCQEGGEMEVMAQVLMAFLAKFQPSKCITFEWANVCSRMHSGAFSGGAMFVTAQGYIGHHVGDWLVEQGKLFQEEQDKSNG